MLQGHTANKVVFGRHKKKNAVRKGYKKVMAWNAAFKAARKKLLIKGFKPCKKGAVSVFLFTIGESEQ